MVFFSFRYDFVFLFFFFFLSSSLRVLHIAWHGTARHVLLHGLAFGENPRQQTTATRMAAGQFFAAISYRP